MEETALQQKNQKSVTVLSWVLIILSALVLIRSVIPLQSLSYMVTIKGITKDFNPPVELNFAPFIIQNAIELILNAIIFVSAVFVLKFRNVWRQILIYTLIASIIFLLLSPLSNYFYPTFLKAEAINSAQKELIDAVKESMLIRSYIWTAFISILFIYAIRKLTREEIKILFR